MNTTTELFKLLPIDWQAIGAVVTFLAVIISFITLRFYRKKEIEQIKREIGEKILEKLNRELEELKNSAKNCQMYFSSFLCSWRELKKTTLSYHNEFRSLRESFNKFEELLENKKILGERRKKLESIIDKLTYAYLFDYFNFRNRSIPLKLILLRTQKPQSLEEIQNMFKEIENETMRFKISAAFVIEENGSWMFQGNLFQLAFEGKTFKECKEKIISDFVKKGFKEDEILKRWKLKVGISWGRIFSEEKHIDLGEYIDDNGLEVISKKINETIEKDSELNELIKACRETHEKALNLQKQIEEFLMEATKRKLLKSRVKS